MSEIGDRMALIAAELAAKYPARKVRRAFVDFAELGDTELAAGVYTLLSAGEEDFTNIAGYVAQDGAQSIMLLGQVKLADDASGEAVEEAELTLVDEVKAFCREIPATLCLLSLLKWRQSMQVERPYGWIACDLGYKT